MPLLLALVVAACFVPFVQAQAQCPAVANGTAGLYIPTITSESSGQSITFVFTMPRVQDRWVADGSKLRLSH